LEIVSVAPPHTARTISGPPPTISAVAYSPDGRQLAFLAQTSHDAPPGISAVYVMPATGGAPRSLSADSSLEVAGREIIWRADGQAVYMQAQQKTRGALIAFPLEGQPQWQAAVAPVANGFSTDPNQDGWAFVAQGPEHLPEIEFAASPTAPGRGLSNANPEWAQSGWRAAEEVNWTGPDNLTIEGLYFAPASCPGGDAASGGKSPMILVVHGGPTGSFIQTFSPFIQWLTSQGWAVLEPNPRGSTGYGWQFAAADRDDLGGKDFEDIMAGVDWALANQPVDAARLGMYGYSYGGEMAGFIEGKTDRFKAIISGAPVIDQYSEYGTEGGSWYDRWFFGQPWLRPQDAWRQSPLSYAKTAKTPLLLLQGEADTTDPLGQSLEMYRALRQMGVEVRLVKFPRENHGPLSGGINGAPSPEPWHGFRGRAEILRWFREHFRS
ncbi:MAG TPA: prolyl oligopeptidase family serine peptidase, partial [Terriglobales bacterium]|nr:prolyl oligopeptidase family serine peptidase [Terriglobales bacterium]